MLQTYDAHAVLIRGLGEEASGPPAEEGERAPMEVVCYRVAR
jgi:hypothetical protein